MRTITEIQNEIITAKNADANLSALNSTSLTAVWRLWTYITAVAIYVHEALWDKHKIEINALVETAIWGTPKWYVATSKKFQYGDAVEQLVDNQPYSIVDTAKQIVTFASYREAFGIIVLKVAKGAIGSQVALTAPEKTAFEGFISKMKGAGDRVNVVSLPADALRIMATIYYDAQYPLATVQANVLDAINNFLFGLPFDGLLYKNKLVDAIDDATGVVNLDQDNATFRGVQGLNNILMATSYQTEAGYMSLDIPNTTLTYIPI